MLNAWQGDKLAARFLNDAFWMQEQGTHFD